jgi:hypothetical protein
MTTMQKVDTDDKRKLQSKLDIARMCDEEST